MQSKKSTTSEKRTRNWWFIVYPDSAPDNWRSILSDLHVQYAISPLHDKDENQNGSGAIEKKKPHWHVIISFDSVKSYSQVQEIVSKFNTEICEPINSIVGAVRYLIHRDDPLKAQYDKNDIVCGGGFDALEILDRRPSDKRVFIKEIYSYIISNDVTEYHELVDYAYENNPDWFDILTEGHTMFFDSVIRSRRHSAKLKKKREEVERAKASEILVRDHGYTVDTVTGELLPPDEEESPLDE